MVNEVFADCVLGGGNSVVFEEFGVGRELELGEKGELYRL